MYLVPGLHARWAVCDFVVVVPVVFFFRSVGDGFGPV